MSALPAARLLPPTVPQSEEWHAQRRTGIGGSDASTIMGFNPYDNVVDLWRLKRGEIAHDAKEQTEAMNWGHLLEPVVADWMEARLQDELDERLYLRHPEGTYQNIERPHLLANLDRLLYHEEENGPLAGVEIKTVGLRGSGDWNSGGIAVHALWQAIHYMAVTGLDRFYFGCLIAGQKFVMRMLDRPADLVDELLEAEDHFWYCVESGECPDLTSIGDARRFWPEAIEGEVVDLSEIPEAAGLLAERRRLDDYLKNYTDARAAVDEEVQRLLGPAEVGLIHGEPAVTWKNRLSRRLDTKALEAEHPDLAEKYRKTTTTRTFLVK